MTKFYVGTGGNDSSAGTTYATRWLTLGKVAAYQAASGAAGDEYYLVGGSTFDASGGALAVGQSSCFLRAHRENAYDAPPVISGAWSIGAGDWADVGGGIYTITLTGITADIDHVYFGEVLGKKQALVGDVNAAYEWHFATGTSLLTVYCATGNPTTIYTTMQAVVFDSALSFNGKSNVVVEGVKLQDWGAGGAITGGVYSGLASSGTGNKMSHCILDNRALAQLYAAATNAGQTWEFSNNTVVRAKNVVDNLAGTSTAHSNLCLGITGYAFTRTLGTMTYANNRGWGIAAWGGTGTTDGGSNYYEEDPKVRHFLRHTGITYGNLSVDDYDNDNSALNGENAWWFEQALAVFRERSERDNTNYALGVGVVAAGEYVNSLDADHIRMLRDQGCEICNHSYSHASGAQDTLIKIKVPADGAVTVATVTIGTNTLTTSITGGAVANLNIDLTNASYNTLKKLVDYINSVDGYVAEYVDEDLVHDNTKSIHLGDCTGEDILDTWYSVATDYTTLLADEAKSCHDYLVGIGVTPSSVYLYPHGAAHADHPTALANATNGGYTGGRLAYLSSPSEQSFGMGVNPYWIPCQFISEATVTPTAAEIARGIDVQKKTFSFVGNIMALGQVIGLPITFYTHPYNWTHPSYLGIVLDAILEHGTYASLATINTAIRAQTALTANASYAIGTVLTNNWNLESDSPCIGVGNQSTGKTELDVNGRVVPYGLPTDIGAAQYFHYDILNGATITDVTEQPKLLGSTSASVAAAATGTLTITSAPIQLGLDSEGEAIANPSIIVQLVPSATTYTVTGATCDIIPIFTADKDISPTSQDIVTLCGCRRHDLRRGILGETSQDPYVTGAAQSAAAGTPIGSYDKSTAKTLIWECRETLPWSVPFVVRVTITCTNGDGSTVTMYAAAWAVGLK